MVTDYRGGGRKVEGISLMAFSLSQINSVFFSAQSSYPESKKQLMNNFSRSLW
jgi:hypothetical protein